MRKLLTVIILIVVLVGCICALFACAPKDQGTPASTYIISFNTNGGSSIKSISLKSGSNLTLPSDPIREGFVFTGWYFDIDCEHPVNVALFRVISNTTIFAGWESIETYRHFVSIDRDLRYGSIKVISPEDGRASFGTKVQVSITPEDGYDLVEGTLKANNILLEHESAQIYSFTMPKSNVVITCEFDYESLNVSLLDTFENGLIVLSQDSARPGEYVSVQVVPDYGYRLTELYIINNENNGTGEDLKISILNSYSFIMGRKEVVVGAEFEKIDYETEYNINLATQGNGAVTIKDSSLPAGLYVDLEFLPQEGYKLDNFIVSGESWNSFISADANGFVMPDQDVTVTAYFSKIFDDAETYDIVINQSQDGQVAIRDDLVDFRAGEKVELVITPNEGYAVKNIFVNGSSLMGNTFIMPSKNATITAEFVRVGHNINVTAYNCEVILSKTNAYAGDVVYFDIIEHIGYNLNPYSVTLDGVILEEDYFIMPDKDVTISAVSYSSTEKYTITSEIINGGIVKSNLEEASPYEKVLLTPVPALGYKFKPNSLSITYFRESEKVEQYLSDYSFIMPSSNVVISARFERAYNAVALEGNDVSVYPDKETFVLGEIVWLDVVAHGDVVLDSIEGRVQFGNYSEPLTGVANFELTNEKLALAGANPTLTIRIDAYSKTTANKSYAINVKSSNGGVVRVDGKNYGQYGAIIRLNILADDGYKLASLYLTTNSGENYPINDTFIMPNSTVTITPTFAESSDTSFSLNANYLKNIEKFNESDIKVEYFREKHQFIERYPALKEHKFLSNLVGTVKVDATLGHDFYLIEVNDVDMVNPIAHVAHDFIAQALGVEESQIAVYINYNYIVLSVGGNPYEDFYAFKNGIERVGDFLLYERKDGTYGVYSYVGNGGYVTIPEEYNHRSVSYLSSLAFANSEQILGINLSNLKEIDDFALAKTSIKYIDLKDVKYLGVGVFRECNALKEFSVSSLNSALSVKDGVLYTKNDRVNYLSLYAYPLDRVAIDDSYSLPSQTVEIQPYAFYGAKVKKVSYGGSLSIIGDYAFAYSNLQSLKYTSATAIEGVVDFSTNNTNRSIVSVLGEGAFKGCVGLKNFYLDTITQIGNEAFTWDGTSTMVISLSGDFGIGVVKMGGNPIEISTTQTGILKIYIPNSLKELYLSDPKWSKYIDYFSFI